MSDDLVNGWDELKDTLPYDHAVAADLLFDYGDKLADRIEAMIADRDALRKRVEAADRLAELVAELLESESDHQTEWDITAKHWLAAYSATEEQSHE